MLLVMSICSRTAGVSLRRLTKHPQIGLLHIEVQVQSPTFCRKAAQTHFMGITQSCPSSVIPQALHCCVAGSNLHTQQSHYLLSLSDLSTDYDLMLGQVKSFEPPPSQTATTDFGDLLTVAEGKDMEPSVFLFVVVVLPPATLHWTGR